MAVRKKIMQLAKKICGATALMIKLDEKAPEYYVLACCVTDQQAEVGLAMELRKPHTVEEIASKCKKSVEETARLADELAKIGACVCYTLDGTLVYELTVYVPGVMEKMVGNKELCEKHPEIAKAFEEYARLRAGLLAPFMPVGLGPMRVVPIQRALDGNSKVADFEEISKLMDRHTIFAVADCSCRRSRRILGEGCGHLEKDICIQMGTGAEYYIRAGKARQITREEAEAIIRKAEDNGLMHQIPNIDGDGQTHAICNCCACSCYSLRNALLFNSPDMIRSNYVSQVDKDKCVACGQCVENCPANALKLGQKLCSKTPIELKSVETTRDRFFKKSEYNYDYRENREDTVESGTAPCKTACPAHIAVQGYIKLASQSKYTEALELIKKENPLPAVCGRICPHKCEDACTRAGVDQPIAIDEIKKFIADKDLDAKTRFIPQKRNDFSDKKVAIVGAGPAGLSCAYYLALDNYSVTVFEKEEKLGGMLTLGIPSFRLEKEVVNAEIDVLKQLGVEFKTGVEVGKDITLKQLREQGYNAFYIAIGAQKGRKLGLKGEDATGVVAGVDFLRDVNLGKDIKLSGKVVVIGGGNVAIDVARTASRVGAKTVDMFSLEQRSEMPALPEEIEEAENEQIIINNGWGPVEIVAENGKVKAVIFKKCVSVFDENGKFAPKYDEKQTKTVETDAVLLSVGQSIDLGTLLEGSAVKLNRNNTIVADSFTYQTDEKDIFVGGDVYTGPNFAINAIAAGKEGAISIHRYVHEGQSLTLGRDRRIYRELNKENAIIEGYDNTQRQRPLHKAENEKSFKDTRATFTEEQLKKETERCLGCGAVQVDQLQCVGCGMCVTKCKFDAISLTKKYDGHGTKFELLPVKMAPNIIKRVSRATARRIKDTVKGN